jgi:hypothetical protein
LKRNREKIFFMHFFAFFYVYYIRKVRNNAMNTKTMLKSLNTLVCIGLLVMLCSFTTTLAWRGGGGGGHGGGGHWGGGYHDHYWGGYHGWGWYGYPTIVVEDPYDYYYGAPYPVYTEGYVTAVAPAPAVAPASTQPAAQSNAAVQPKMVNDTIVQSKGTQESIGDSVTLYVPNSKGRFTPVTLIKRANGYIGPQGEFYPNNPTIAQLRAVYGN